MSVLQEICDRKRAHVKEQKKRIPLEQLKEHITDTPRGFIKALKNHQGTAIIAEVKKASPSKGVIREDFDAVEIAKIYEDGGAACLSVLTDEPYFQGRDEYLQDIRKAVKLPLLRKDFMIDPYQIHESRALGADCILLIMAALHDKEARELYDISTQLGMDVLVEVHNAEELERAMKLNPQMIGVNNRSLKTLHVDIQTSFTLADTIPLPALKVAESGISDAHTIETLQKAGFGAFLVGESLMREANVSKALARLLQK
jgi:indole-3-glycerol phosphate synthase